MTGTVAGVTPLTNQWYKGTTRLTGQTNLTFSIPNAAVGDSGAYTLVVANAYAAVSRYYMDPAMRLAATGSLNGPCQYWLAVVLVM